MTMPKYNFEYEKPIVTIFASGSLYFPKELIDYYGLDKPMWRFAEDKENHILALFKNCGGKRKTYDNRKMSLSKNITRIYEGQYTLIEEENGLIFVPLKEN